MSRQFKIYGCGLAVCLLGALAAGENCRGALTSEEIEAGAAVRISEETEEAARPAPVREDIAEQAASEKPEAEETAEQLASEEPEAEETAEQAASEKPEAKETAAQEEPVDYPADLMEFVEKYPEAAAFALAYPEKKDAHEEIDISGDVKEGEIPLFLQWDERWGYETYGSHMMGISGCGPTCLAMVQCGLSGDTKWNPYEVAKMAEEQGYYVKGVGSSWDLMTEGARYMDLEAWEIGIDREEILQALEAGEVLICSMRPGDFTDSGHFIVLCGIDEQGDIMIRDPNSRINSEKTWKIKKLVSQMKGAWAYSY